jgi:hypothetical protein
VGERIEDWRGVSLLGRTVRPGLRRLPDITITCTSSIWSVCRDLEGEWAFFSQLVIWRPGLAAHDHKPATSDAALATCVTLARQVYGCRSVSACRDAGNYW